MLLKHSALYLLARGLPGLVTFMAIAVFTRLLPPEEYGRYALVVAGVGFFNVVLFQWLRLALLRFLPAHLENPRTLLSTVLAAFVALALLTGAGGLLLAWFWLNPSWRGLALLGVPLLWVQAWFELNLELARSHLQPLRYGLMGGVKAVCALTVGAVAALWGLGAYGPLLGLLAGMLLAVLLWGLEEWSGTCPIVSRVLLCECLRYGLPFTVTFALGFVVSTSDRFLIAWFLGDGPAGVYAAGYDLAWNSLGLLMGVINLAAYPHVVRAFERGGASAAQEQIAKNFIMLTTLSVPATAGFIVLSTPIGASVLGAHFAITSQFLPWVAIANFLFGLKVYHADLAFQLAKKTRFQMYVSAIAAVINLMLNFLWIPAYGLKGAAYATVVAYGISLFASYVWSRGLMRVQLPVRDLSKVFIATLLMVIILLLVGAPSTTSMVLLPAWILVGALTYSISIVLLDVAGLRGVFSEVGFILLKSKK